MPKWAPGGKVYSWRFQSFKSKTQGLWAIESRRQMVVNVGSDSQGLQIGRKCCVFCREFSSKLSLRPFSRGSNRISGRGCWQTSSTLLPLKLQEFLEGHLLRKTLKSVTGLAGSQSGRLLGLASRVRRVSESCESKLLKHAVEIKAVEPVQLSTDDWLAYVPAPTIMNLSADIVTPQPLGTTPHQPKKHDSQQSSYEQGRQDKKCSKSHA